MSRFDVICEMGSSEAVKEAILAGLGVSILSIFAAKREISQGLLTVVNVRDCKPMPIVGSGVREILIHILGEWRVIHVAKLHHMVYVLHTFQKKTRKPDKRDVGWPNVTSILEDRL